MTKLQNFDKVNGISLSEESLTAKRKGREAFSVGIVVFKDAKQ